MRNPRLFWNSVLLCLPTILVVAGSVFFFVDKVPDIEKAERDRVKAEYREAALLIRQSPSEYQIMKDPPECWKPAGKMAPGKWGFCPISLKGVTWVWYNDGTDTRTTMVPIVCETNYRLLFTFWGTVFLVVLILITAVSIRYFVRYIKSRDDFLKATAHDLATPLTGMKLAIGSDTESAKLLADRMTRLVTNLKDFLKLGGRPAPKRESFDLVKAYQEAYGLFAEEYRDLFNGRDVAFTGPETLMVSGDETLTVQILWNLLGNDLKYAAPDGDVRVQCAAEDGFACLEFIDEGKGMTPRQMRRAFDRYYRAQTVLESGKGGFGIGLCTAKEFAKAMNGSLSLRANTPRGCIFTLKLPLV